MIDTRHSHSESRCRHGNSTRYGQPTSAPASLAEQASRRRPPSIQHYDRRPEIALRAAARADRSRLCRRQHQFNGNEPEKEDATKARPREHQHRTACERAAADPVPPPGARWRAPQPQAEEETPPRPAQRRKRHNVTRAMIEMMPGRTKSPPGMAPGQRCISQSDIDGKVVPSGPGSSMPVTQRGKEPRFTRPISSRRRWRCITAICPAGPPKLRAADPQPHPDASLAIPRANAVRLGNGIGDSCLDHVSSH